MGQLVAKESAWGEISHVCYAEMGRKQASVCLIREGESETSLTDQAHLRGLPLVTEIHTQVQRVEGLRRQSMKLTSSPKLSARHATLG